MWWAIGIGAVVIFIIHSIRTHNSISEAAEALSGDYVIEYFDENDEYSRRGISNIRKVGSNIYAHCHLRGETRTFKISRIEDPILCLDTGESLKKREWLGGL